MDEIKEENIETLQTRKKFGFELDQECEGEFYLRLFKSLDDPRDEVLILHQIEQYCKGVDPVKIIKENIIAYGWFYFETIGEDKLEDLSDEKSKKVKELQVTYLRNILKSIYKACPAVDFSEARNSIYQAYHNLYTIDESMLSFLSENSANALRNLSIRYKITDALTKKPMPCKKEEKKELSKIAKTKAKSFRMTGNFR